jgi:hypothetical protein
MGINKVGKPWADPKRGLRNSAPFTGHVLNQFENFVNILK